MLPLVPPARWSQVDLWDEYITEKGADGKDWSLAWGLIYSLDIGASRKEQRWGEGGMGGNGKCQQQLVFHTLPKRGINIHK